MFIASIITISILLTSCVKRQKDTNKKDINSYDNQIEQQNSDTWKLN